MSDGQSRKKYWRKNNYGKYYTYRRIRNIMNTYFRAKISFQADTIWDNNNIGYRQVNVNHGGQTFSNNELIVNSSSWPSYRRLFGFYKPRGMLVETTPKFQNVAYYDSQAHIAFLPYTGSIAIGLYNSDQVIDYQVLADQNSCLVLSTVTKQRVYWPFTIKDFSQMPVYGGEPTGFPYYLCIAQDARPDANQIFPNWALRVTYYITMRQSSM